MAGSFVVNGDEVTLTFEYTALTQKVMDTVNDAIAYLYPNVLGDFLEGEVLPFEELTNQQKLTLLDSWLKKNILDLAKAQNQKVARRNAEIAAEAEAGDKYI